MKEQDAAHSFDKRVDAICEVCKFNDAIHYDNNKYFCCGCFAKELTRLRSELQQKNELNINTKILSTALRAQLKIEIDEVDRLRSELQQKNEAVLELSEILVIAYDALSVVRTEPTMSGSVLASFDKNKFIKIRGDFFEFLDKHKTLESLIKKAKLNN